MKQQKTEPSPADGQDLYIVSDQLFRLFWNRVKVFLSDQFTGKAVPPLMMVLQRPPADVQMQASAMEGVPMAIGIADMSMFYSNDAKASGKTAAASFVRKMLDEEETLLVATINEAWMVYRKTDDMTKGPKILDGAVSEQPDRQEQLMVVLHSKMRQALSLSPIKEENGIRLIDFQDYVFNNENGAMFNSFYDQTPLSTAIN